MKHVVKNCRLFFHLVIATILVVSIFANVKSAVAEEGAPPPPTLTGWTHGTGTHFELPDSSYLPVTLDSSVAVTITLSSVPEVVDLLIEPDNEAGSAEFTLGGFAANTLYYHYVDSGLNPIRFMTDTTGSFSYTQDLTEMHHVWFQPQPSTYQLYDNATGGDCTLFGTWSSVTKTCTMTQNVDQSIYIQASGITLDGNGFSSLQSKDAVYSSGKSNLTIKNLNVSGANYGIFLVRSDNATIKNLNVSNTKYAVFFYTSNNATIENSTLSGSTFGIYCRCANITITDNLISSDYRGIDIGSDNIFSIVNVSNNTIINTTFGIYNSCSYCRVKIDKNNISGDRLSGGIYNQLHHNSDDTFITNNIISGYWLAYGIYHLHSDGSSEESVSIENNVILSESVHYYSTGIKLYSTRGSGTESIMNNTISGFDSGIYYYGFGDMSSTTFFQNSISNSKFGVQALYPSYWTMTNNTISNSPYGVFIDNRLNSEASIYNNNFINSGVYDGFWASSFNQPAPIGGNYYSYYDTPAEGCYDTNEDNFCDSAYVFERNQDNLPWTKQNGWLPNQPPSADAGGLYSGYEGSAIAMSTASASDPDQDPLIYNWSVDSDLCSFDDSNLLNPTVTCADNGSFTATLDVSDGTITVSSTAAVDIANAAPILGGINIDKVLVPINTPIDASANFTDPGSLDIHTAIWDWGDGTNTTGIITQGVGFGSVADVHSYSIPGIYTIKLTVTDNDGSLSNESVYQYLVVYDPDGGFISGAGWIDSPEGAYVADPSLSGKAIFGFVSKYQKGAIVPDGNARFIFNSGDLHFQSSSYQWLVVAGSRAQFKGQGAINGAGNFGFMLTAIDGQVNSKDGVDKFRIKIWNMDNGDAIVYDNLLGGADDADPTTELGGGSIVIH